MKIENVIIVTDLEGIIGIKDINNASLCHKYLFKQLEVIIATLNGINIKDITVGNIHNDGLLITDNDANKLGIKLLKGVNNLILDKFEYSFAILMGFHGKRNSGGYFDHTFRFDISSIYYNGKNIGEVAAYKELLEYKRIPVVFISGEGNYIDEITDKRCIYHKVENKNKMNSNLSYYYYTLKKKLKISLTYINKKLVSSNHPVFVFVNNNDKYELLSTKYEVSNTRKGFVFKDIDDFFKHLYDFCKSMNEINSVIANKNLRLINLIRSKVKNKESKVFIDFKDKYNFILEKSIYDINKIERKEICNYLSLDYYEND